MKIPETLTPEQALLIVLGIVGTLLIVAICLIIYLNIRNSKIKKNFINSMKVGDKAIIFSPYTVRGIISEIKDNEVTLSVNVPIRDIFPDKT